MVRRDMSIPIIDTNLEMNVTDTMEDWDEAKLRSVVLSKHGNPRTTTDVCNDALHYALLIHLCRLFANSSSMLLKRRSAQSSPVFTVL